MVEEHIHIQVNTQELLQTLRPNVKKQFLSTLIMMTLGLVLIIGIILYLNDQVGLETFAFVLDMVAVSITQKQFVTYSIFIVVGAFAGVLLFNYLNLKNVRYEFYRNRIEIYESQLLVLTNKTVVSLDNINRVTYTSEGIMNQMLKSGTVVVELTGLKIPSVQLIFMDNTAQVTAYVQNVIEYARSIKQMEFQENYKINDIMRKF